MIRQYRLKDVYLTYLNKTILEVPELNIAAGSRVCFVGPNGAGKSTLLNVFALLKRPTSGTLEYSGEQVVDKNQYRLRKGIAYVQQKPYLFDMTVQQNIELGLKLRSISASERKRRADSLIEQLQITHLVGRKIHGLSGGEIQKIVFARALVLEPEVLILDEPMSHLDRESVIFFQQFLVDWQKKHQMSMITTSHDRVSAQLMSDTVYSLMNGCLFKSSLTNVLQGVCDYTHHIFDTGKLQIKILADKRMDTNSVRHLVIDPEVLVLSHKAVSSSMRNQFPGRVIAMKECGKQVHLKVDCGELFHAVITQNALEDMNINLGSPIWLAFKSSAVRLF